MELAQNILKIAVLILSFWGYYRLMRVEFKIKNEFCPAVVLSSIGCILFVFGCINLLVPCANALLILGAALFIYYTFVKKSPLQGDFSIGIGVWLALTLFLILRLRGAHFYDCDNYNHWGLIIKNMMYDSAFPDSSDEIIRFTSYSTGSTVVIWYFLRLWNYSECWALFFQDFLMMSCGISFFAFVDKINSKKTIAAGFFALLGTFLMFTCDKYLFNGPFDLLVDQLIATVGVTAYLIVDYYKGDNKKALWVALPLLTYEITVKNSGMLFTYAVAVILVYRFLKNRKSAAKKSEYIIPSVIALGVPFIIRKIWDLRVKLTFNDNGISIHSVSLTNYQSIFAEKTPDDIRSITDQYLEKAISFDNVIVIFLVIFIILFALFEYRREKNEYSILSRMLYVICVYLIYQVGMYCMYIFSMPMSEAYCLPCYFRYIMTIDMFVFGIIILLLIKICTNEKFPNIIPILAVVFSTVLLMIYSVDNLLPMFVPREITDKIETTDYMRSVFDKYDLPQDQYVSYLVYVSDLDDFENYNQIYDYKYHCAQYNLYSAHLDMLRKCQLADYSDFYNYDYLIIIHEDDEIREFLNSNSIDYSECIHISEY